MFIDQLYKKLTLLFFSSKFKVLIKYDYKVCISGSNYLMQCYSPHKHFETVCPPLIATLFCPYKNPECVTDKWCNILTRLHVKSVYILTVWRDSFFGTTMCLEFLFSCQYTHSVTWRVLGLHDTLPCVLMPV